MSLFTRLSLAMEYLYVLRSPNQECSDLYSSSKYLYIEVMNAIIRSLLLRWIPKAPPSVPLSGTGSGHTFEYPAPTPLGDAVSN